MIHMKLPVQCLAHAWVLIPGLRANNAKQNKGGNPHRTHIPLEIDNLKKLINIFQSMLEVNTPVKKSKGGLSRSVMLSRAGREDLTDKVVFDQRCKRDEK